MADFKQGWSAYYDVSEGKPPRQTLLLALAACDRENIQNKLAADLACGNGVDTVELLRRGWQVLACDKNPEAIERLAKRADLENAKNLRLEVQSLEELRLAADSLWLVNASYAFPFCNPNTFPQMWQQIEAALKVGGRFCGQFFGPNDTWTRNPELTFFSEASLKQLLKSFIIETWQEEEYDGTTALGNAKHWHVFNIVAQKQKYD